MFAAFAVINVSGGIIVKKETYKAVQESFQELFNQLTYALWLFLCLGAAGWTSYVSLHVLRVVPWEYVIFFWALPMICIFNWYHAVCVYLSKGEQP